MKMDPFMRFETLNIETNLDTRLQFSFSETDTVSEIKEKIMHEHPTRYPDLGPIEICSLKVKRRGNLYHLMDDMLVMPTFARVTCRCFYYADISRTNHVAGEDNQMSDAVTEKLAADSVSLDASTSDGNPLKKMKK